MLLACLFSSAYTQQYLYSRSTANTWSTTDGGSDCSCTPTSTDTVDISHNWANPSFYPLTHPANLAHGTYFPVSSTDNPFKVIIRSGGVGYQTGTVPTGMILQVDAGGFWGYNGSVTLQGVDLNTIALLGNEGTVLANGSFTNKIALTGAGKFCRSGSFSQNSGGTLNGNSDLSLDPYFVDAEYGTFCMDASALPVELISFKAQKVGEIVVIKWGTFSELNSDKFIVERSTDGVNFEEILQTRGAGNSSEILHYEGVDINPKEGINYYRLKQIDFDGKFEYFTTVAVMLSPESNLMSNVYPNPATHEIKFTTSLEETYFISVYNSLGKIVECVEIKGDQLGAEVSINTSKFAKGNYFIKIDNQKGYFVSKRFQKL